MSDTFQQLRDDLVEAGQATFAERLSAMLPPQSHSGVDDAAGGLCCPLGEDTHGRRHQPGCLAPDISPDGGVRHVTEWP